MWTFQPNLHDKSKALAEQLLSAEQLHHALQQRTHRSFQIRRRRRYFTPKKRQKTNTIVGVNCGRSSARKTRGTKHLKRTDYSIGEGKQVGHNIHVV